MNFVRGVGPCEYDDQCADGLSCVEGIFYGEEGSVCGPSIDSEGMPPIPYGKFDYMMGFETPSVTLKTYFFSGITIFQGFSHF